MQNPEQGTAEGLANTDSGVRITSCALQATLILTHTLRRSLAHWDSWAVFVIHHYGFDVRQGLLPTGTAASFHTLLPRLSTQQFLFLLQSL